MNQHPNDQKKTSLLAELPAGILLVDKPKNKTSFALVGALRRLLKVKKIGHSGTLDPFATGVMVMLIGKQYTRLSDRFLKADKEYLATVLLGIETDSYDCDGKILKTSPLIPTEADLNQALKNFQGLVLQIPPMFSAKKKGGKKLYELARKGISIERDAVAVTMLTELIEFHYPFVKLRISCSKGTYIRSIAHDLGNHLNCGAHLSELQRVRSGAFHLANCLNGAMLDTLECDVELIKSSLIKNCEPFL